MYGHLVHIAVEFVHVEFITNQYLDDAITGYDFFKGMVDIGGIFLQMALMESPAHASIYDAIKLAFDLQNESILDQALFTYGGQLGNAKVKKIKDIFKAINFLVHHVRHKPILYQPNPLLSLSVLGHQIPAPQPWSKPFQSTPCQQVFTVINLLYQPLQWSSLQSKKRTRLTWCWF
ncbi:hypothetical protein SUGI_0534400 [Cryptomeria japonica]|nr:hypothetical protein SUGI_0534400 [Cryptomeria japonica]